MNKDDVLLKDTDLRDIKVIFKHVYEASLEDIAKAAQLKLLDVLNQDCKHGFSVIKCAECMSEIEKILKEG